MQLPFGLTVSHLVAAGLVLLVVVILKKVFAVKEDNAHVIHTRCGKCGWTGDVSKYKPVCPKCASPLRG